ncbi:hypothetical protein, conserved [Trypanosoma brucei gambiense DAL972]|uniref:Sulfhydryl oxidase n=2 Tax=Trypanosoma brucei TaxID=5691 RepID=C9ZQJ7_TRYB9|nr:hypothetical protein, conserved [Trypanosoma brucei gambiense DAL972]CBH11677.1 hypothetical protein, conserved [Trypanosoma brucei gambiense DAL972]|eukprot:XP_011773962.1 hypothetical protein, conserved [Trypanosoma brucei gambiense DAL972]
MFSRSFVVFAGLLCCCLSKSVAQVATGTPRPGLFHLDSSVVDLSGDDFSRVHRVAPLCPWIVLFYNDGCGACRRYASTFSKFAGGLKVEHGKDALQIATAAAVNCASEVDLCRKYDINFVPRLFFFYPRDSCRSNEECGASSLEHVAFENSHLEVDKLESEVRRLVNKHMVVDDSLKERCIDMHFKLYTSKEELVKRSVSSTDESGRFVETTELYATDIAGAFFSAMHYDVSLVGTEPRERLTALEDFVLLVKDSLPSIGADGVVSALESITAERPFTVTSWQDAVVKSGIPFDGSPRNVRWRTCRGSSPQYRGFPCGMWLLLHALTVNTPADRNVLEVIQNYIRYFFSCKECRDHFIQFNFSPNEDPVLQLWRAHNNVNARLANVKDGADPLVPKRQFPTLEACTECYDGAGNFIEAHVTDFLKQRYLWDPKAVGLTESNNDLNDVDPASKDANVGRNVKSSGKGKGDGGARGNSKEVRSDHAGGKGKGYSVLLFSNVFIILLFVCLGSFDYMKRLRVRKRRDRY